MAGYSTEYLQTIDIFLTADLIVWPFKSKQYVHVGERFERTCETTRPLEATERLSWSVHGHDGRRQSIEATKLVIDAFAIDNEGIAICQIKDSSNNLIDEKYFVLTNDRE